MFFKVCSGFSIQPRVPGVYPTRVDGWMGDGLDEREKRQEYREEEKKKRERTNIVRKFELSKKKKQTDFFVFKFEICSTFLEM